MNQLWCTWYYGMTSTDILLGSRLTLHHIQHHTSIPVSPDVVVIPLPSSQPLVAMTSEHVLEADKMPKMVHWLQCACSLIFFRCLKGERVFITMKQVRIYSGNLQSNCSTFFNAGFQL